MDSIKYFIEDHLKAILVVGGIVVISGLLVVGFNIYNQKGSTIQDSQFEEFSKIADERGIAVQRVYYEETGKDWGKVERLENLQRGVYLAKEYSSEYRGLIDGMYYSGTKELRESQYGIVSDAEAVYISKSGEVIELPDSSKATIESALWGEYD